MEQYLFVDVAFLTNWLTDWAWLWATGAAAGLTYRQWRLGLAAGAGAAAAVWSWFPSGLWLTGSWGKVAGSGALLLLAFWPLRLRTGLRALAWLLISGSVMAGGAYLSSLWVGTGSGTFASGPVAAGLLLSLLGVRFLWESAVGRTRQVRGLYQLRVRLGSRSVTLPALLDTGHDLRDPLSGDPVLVVEAAALGAVLPPEVCEAVTAGWEALERLPGIWAGRCRLVPYRAVGREGGMLLALYPDEIAVLAPGGERWQQVRGLIGISAFGLQREGRYRALLPERLAAGDGA